MAIAGMLGVAGLLAATALFGESLLPDVVRDSDGRIAESGIINTSEDGALRRGDCLVKDIPWFASIWDRPDRLLMTGLPCEEEHDAEVAALIEGPDRVVDRCLVLVDAYVGGSVEVSRLSLDFYDVGTEEPWTACVLSSSRGAQLVGTVRSVRGAP